MSDCSLRAQVVHENVSVNGNSGKLVGSDVRGVRPAGSVPRVTRMGVSSASALVDHLSAVPGMSLLKRYHFYYFVWLFTLPSIILPRRASVHVYVIET